MLEREIAHDVEALEESALLLTIAWPENTEQGLTGLRDRAQG